MNLFEVSRGEHRTQKMYQVTKFSLFESIPKVVLDPFTDEELPNTDPLKVSLPFSQLSGAWVHRDGKLALRLPCEDSRWG